MWGKTGETVWVNPRPHGATWVAKAQKELEQREAQTQWLFASLSRERGWRGIDIKELLKFVEPLFDGKHKIRRLWLWETAPSFGNCPRTASNCLRTTGMRRFSHRSAWWSSSRWIALRESSRESVQWLGEAPVAPLNTHEVLVVEMSVPPATRQRSASEVLKGAVKKVAREAGLDAPPVLQQAAMTGRLAYGKMAVPESQVAAWLKASGQNGLCVRPFFTAATPENINRGAFRVRWVKVGPMEATTIHRIWDAVRSCRGVWGLVLGDGDVGIRLRQGEADMEAVASALQTAGVEVKAKPEGVRWWCLEALRETELGMCLVWRQNVALLSRGMRGLRGRGRGGGRPSFEALGTPPRRHSTQACWGVGGSSSRSSSSAKEASGPNARRLGRPEQRGCCTGNRWSHARTGPATDEAPTNIRLGAETSDTRWEAGEAASSGAAPVDRDTSTAAVAAACPTATPLSDGAKEAAAVP